MPAPRNPGTNGGPPPGTRNGLEHGIWSTLYTKEEVEWASQHVWNDVTAEIELIRIRLRRLLIAEARQLNHDGQMTDVELQEILTEAYKTKTGKQVGNLLEKKRFKRTDFTNIFSMLVQRLESLVRTQGDLLKNERGEAGEPDGEAPITTIRVEVVGAKVQEPGGVEQVNLEPGDGPNP